MTVEQLRTYNRICVIGSPGAGKSWLSKKLAAITGLPLIHLDREHHLPNWGTPPKDEWRAKMQSFVQGDRWIIDGNYGSTMEIRFAVADLVIFLDYSRVLCVISAIKRRGEKRSDMPDYLDEPPLFSKDYLEFLKYIWDFPKQGRKRITGLIAEYPDVPVLRLRNRKMLNFE